MEEKSFLLIFFPKRGLAGNPTPIVRIRFFKDFTVLSAVFTEGVSLKKEKKKRISLRNLSLLSNHN